MTAAQIPERILGQSDEELLKSLPTEQRLACRECATVSVVKRSHSGESGKYFCPTCNAEQLVKTVTFYKKNKTIDPVMAVARHRIFWNKIYFEQLGREIQLVPAPALK